MYFYIFTFSFFSVFFTCNSAFEQGHLEPWRYINAFIIIIIIIIYSTVGTPLTWPQRRSLV